MSKDEITSLLEDVRKDLAHRSWGEGLALPDFVIGYFRQEGISMPAVALPLPAA